MNRIHEERQVLFLCLATDLIVYWLAMSLSTLSRLDVLGRIDYSTLERDRLVCLALFALCAIIAGAYKPQRLTDRFDSAYYVLIALAWTGLLQFTATAFVPAGVREITRREIIISLILTIVFTGLWRSSAAPLISRFKAFRRHFYVIGSPKLGGRIAEEITQNRLTARASADFIDIDTLKIRATQTPENNLENDVSSSDAIIALDPEEHAKLDEMLLFCRENCHRAYLYPSIHDLLLLQQRSLSAVAGIPLIEIASKQLVTPYTYIKRMMDIAFAVAGLIFSSPICLGAAIAVRATSPGGVIYSQERLGRGGKPFRIYKFRSMTSSIELKNESGHVIAQENDPRVTPVGKFIRKHRIDEIPQLWNVLKGDMSLIGPRPVWREFYEANDERLPLYSQRLAVRPGLTCLSHILGSYSSEPEDRLMYDLLYISTLSFLIDFRVLVGTVRIVLSGKGAL
jgi:exopolysaccharide biosynthesis polyprenyl glycosylphosphotransferase